MAFAFLALASSALAVQNGSLATTIYVSRHFEVRDHDQPTKYVFNGETRVAEVTGSLSANLRVQRLRLYPGWNLCSLAVSGLLPISGGTNPGDILSSAFRWKVTVQNWTPVTNNEVLAAGTVLWLKAKTNATLAILGTYSDPTTRQVQAGGAYIPTTGLEAWSPDFPEGHTAWFHDQMIKQWSQRLAGDLAFFSDPPPALSPGQSIYIKAATSVDLQMPDPRLRTRYYHGDHLGSSSVITDAAGALVEEVAYYATAKAVIITLRRGSLLAIWHDLPRLIAHTRARRHLRRKDSRPFQGTRRCSTSIPMSWTTHSTSGIRQVLNPKKTPLNLMNMTS